MSTQFLERALLSLDGIFDEDEPIDELSHALQCAANAHEAGAEDDLITAALFHDIARSPLIAPLCPGVAHEKSGAEWLAPIFGERVAWLVGAHVIAKVFLLDHDEQYQALLSPASARSALLQREHVDEALLSHPWFADALALRRFDDAAKDPCAVRPDAVPFLETAGLLVVGH